MGTPGLQGRGGTVAGARSRGRGTQEKGKWFLRLDEFGNDGFAVAVVEPEARRYTLTLHRNEQKRPYSAYSGYSGDSDCSGHCVTATLFSRRGAEGDAEWGHPAYRGHCVTATGGLGRGWHGWGKGFGVGAGAGAVLGSGGRRVRWSFKWGGAAAPALPDL